jgi:hypothetical protein
MSAVRKHDVEYDMEQKNNKIIEYISSFSVIAVSRIFALDCKV